MLDNFFKLSENGTDFKTEIIAGITTFLAMAYILTNHFGGDVENRQLVGGR